jgi:NodT family efflux transporter outer membrane factor (OMF) lipoprotein
MPAHPTAKDHLHNAEESGFVSEAATSADFAIKAGEKTRFVSSADFAIKAEVETRFVSGHDFSRAENVPELTRALAPEGCGLSISPTTPQSLGAPPLTQFHRGKVKTRFVSSADFVPKTDVETRFVSGHDFSRAENAPELTRALAPEGRGLSISPTTPQSLGVLSLTQFHRGKGGTPRFSIVQVFACLSALALLTGCKPVGPDYNRPGYQAPPAYKEAGATSAVVPPPNPVGGSWQPAAPSDGMIRGKWWEIYQNPQLNQLEEHIAPDNQSLRQSLETYLAARDQISAARSALFPKLSAGPSIQREKISANGPSYSSAKPATYNDFSLTGQASWEPDFWGRVRRTVEAARSAAQASAADTASVDLSLHAEMAADYFQLRGLDAEIKLLQATVADLERQLDLTQRRLVGGVGTEADVAQARTQLETVRAQLVDLGVARAQYEHAIGTIANLDLSAFSIPPSPLDLALPKVPVGVPSQLLERRPDIAAAERRAAAANEQIGIAVSVYYPTITLGGTGGFESMHGGTWLQGPSSLWSLGAQGAELLFDAGQRHALTDQARHTYEAQASAYRASVFAAFNDVEDQLSGLRILEQESTVEQRAVESAQHSFDISNQRYKGGVTSYLEVLTAEATLLQNQRTAIDIQTRQFVANVGLVRALGGGWDASQLPK